MRAAGKGFLSFFAYTSPIPFPFDDIIAFSSVQSVKRLRTPIIVIWSVAVYLNDTDSFDMLVPTFNQKIKKSFSHDAFTYFFSSLIILLEHVLRMTQNSARNFSRENFCLYSSKTD